MTEDRPAPRAAAWLRGLVTGHPGTSCLRWPPSAWRWPRRPRPRAWRSPGCSPRPSSLLSAPRAAVLAAAALIAGGLVGHARLAAIDRAGEGLEPGDRVEGKAHLVTAPRTGPFGSSAEARMAFGSVRRRPPARTLSARGPTAPPAQGSAPRCSSPAPSGLRSLRTRASSTWPPTFAVAVWPASWTPSGSGSPGGGGEVSRVRSTGCARGQSRQSRMVWRPARRPSPGGWCSARTRPSIRP